MSFVNLNKKLDRDERFDKTKIRRGRRWVKILLYLGLIFILLYVPIRGAYTSAKNISSLARSTNDAAKRENLDDIIKNLKEIKKSDDRLNFYLNMMFWVRFIPFIGDYYGDIKHFAKASQYELNAVLKLTDYLYPYKTEIGFSGQPTPGENRVSQLTKILNKSLPKLSDIEPDLKKASKEVSSVVTGKYPENIGKVRVKSKVEAAKNFITGAHFAVTEARDALEIAPSALGEPSIKNYLLIFQNDKELRPTGGFMTAYAFLKLDKGKVSTSTSDDIYRLDEKLLSVCRSKICPLKPPEPIMKYLPEVTGKPRTAWSMRDSNISPDLPTAAKEFERMYQLLGEGLPFDGIIYIDTKVVEELIKITGSVEVFGTTFTSNQDKRCNCPNVIYELENYAQIVERGEQDRKAILGTLMQQILARALGSSLDRLPEFINSGAQLATSKHIMFYMHDGHTQDALTKLNWTGQIKSTDGDLPAGRQDYLHINDSNFAGGKSNLYVEEEVDLNIEEKNGKLVHKLVILYKNPQKYDSWLNQRNRDYVRIYVPKGSKLLSSKGSDVTVTTIEEELGKTVFEAFVEVRPQNSRKLEFEYEVSVKGDNLPMLIQKQPGTKDHKYEVKAGGKKQADFKLDSDKYLKLSI